MVKCHTSNPKTFDISLMIRQREKTLTGRYESGNLPTVIILLSVFGFSDISSDFVDILEATVAQ